MIKFPKLKASNIDKNIKNSISMKPFNFGNINLKKQNFNKSKNKSRPSGNFKYDMPTLDNISKDHMFTKVEENRNRVTYTNPYNRRLTFVKAKDKSMPSFPTPDDIAYQIDESPKRLLTSNTEVRIIPKERYAAERARGTKGEIYKDHVTKDIRNTSANFVPSSGKRPARINIFSDVFHKGFPVNNYSEAKKIFFHETGHSLGSRYKGLSRDWEYQDEEYSPTMYGKTNPSEDLAESYAKWQGAGSYHHSNPLFNSSQLESRKMVLDANIGFLKTDKSAREEWEEKQRPDYLIKEAIEQQEQPLIDNTPVMDDTSNDRVFRLKDGKRVVVKSRMLPVSKRTLNKIYSKIPDDKNIPLVFQTKKQYLKEYIKNQEIKHDIDFPIKQEKNYLNRESKDMKQVVSRYTTKKNKYMEPKTVFFTDRKWTPKEFKASAIHEVAHEVWERNPKARNRWKHVYKNTSPTGYGSTDRQEDFAESYMLFKMGKLTDPKRLKILQDLSSKNKLLEKDDDRQLYYTKPSKKPSAIQGVIGKIIERENIEEEIKKDTGKDMTEVEFLLPTDRTRTVEKKSHATVTTTGGMPKDYPEEDKGFKGLFEPGEGKNVRVYEKPLHPSGTFQDLFKEGDHVEIRNQRGQVVRDLTKEGDDVAINIPGSPSDTIKLSASDEILYEPWMMDRGSFVFQTENAPPGLKGQLLKIATEGDDVTPVKDITSQNNLLDVAMRTYDNPEQTLKRIKEGEQVRAKRKEQYQEVLKTIPEGVEVTEEQRNELSRRLEELRGYHPNPETISKTNLGDEEYEYRQKLARERYGKDWLDLDTSEKHAIRKERIIRGSRYPISEED